MDPQIHGRIAHAQPRTIAQVSFFCSRLHRPTSAEVADFESMEAKALAAESSIDRAQTKDAALKNAILATELYMKATKLASTDQERMRLRTKSKQLLSRAEEIKRSENWEPKLALLKVPPSERSIPRNETIILLEASKLHGFIFPPWTSDPEDQIFDDDNLYTDFVDLKLSDAQKEIFAGWVRPPEIFGLLGNGQDLSAGSNDPSMIATDEIDLVQDVTTDCSVIASLCAGISRALKGHEKFLASIMYPYDEVNMRPCISKNGKYIFRFHFNGCPRKVVIDDRLPASTSSRNLHVVDRKNSRLLWPALIEKAYLKIRGGYDFPGSNSATDLWVLTGWIPEQVFLQNDDIQPQQLWSKVAMSFGFGDVMITLGTGKLTRDEEDEFGLAGEHDYAVLDVKEVDLQRLLLIKNPWCDGMVWKGSHSVSNVSPPAWTEDLRESLPNNCTTTASGTFWMRFEDILQHFESLYLNWNPGLFLHREDHHFTWAPSLTSTPGFFTENPQYSVSTTTKGTIWVMLSRHFSTEEHNIVKKHVATVSGVSSALGFISLYVFDNGGRRVYLSDDALYRGPFVDSPQTLARLEVEPSSAYTIVVAQDSLPLPKYSFTLSFFSRSTLAVNLAEHPLACSTTHKGAWASHTAGGSASAPSYPINPQYSISIPSLTNVTLVLETDQKELAVHVQMVWTGGEQVTSITARDILGGSGDYRRGCALTSLKKVLAGKYTIVCSTFEAGQIGKFTLRVFSTVPCTVVPLLAEAAGRLSRRLQPLTFHNGENRMLTPLSVLRLTRLRVVARYGSASQMSLSKPLLKVSLERGQGPNKTILDSSGSGRFSEALMGIRTADVDLSPGMSQSGGLWIVVERLEGRHCIDDVNVELLSDSAVNVGLWGTGDG